jgi:hypothetical protein
MHEKIWRCTCGTGHYVSIQGIDWEPNERWIRFDGSFRATTLREKLRACYEIFRRGHYDTWLEVRLNQQTATEVRDELTRLLEQ